MHCPPPPTLEVLESVLAKRGLGLRRELVSRQFGRNNVPCLAINGDVQLAPCALLWRFCERFQHESALLHGPEQIADLPVPVVESPGAVRIGHPERSHLVEYLAPNSVFNSLPRQRSSPHLRPDDRLVTIDRVLHHASLGVA